MLQAEYILHIYTIVLYNIIIGMTSFIVSALAGVLLKNTVMEYRSLENGPK